jgi:molecular chaperone GrpE
VTKHKPHKQEPRDEAVAEKTDVPAASAEKAATAQPDDEMAKLRAELEAAKDRELRCRAEMENVRKRAERETEQRLRYANLAIIDELLPALDNVRRAIEAADKNADAAALLDGFKLVEQQLIDTLARHGCKKIEALGAAFDPNVHHAVMQQPSAEHPENTVLAVVQDGYQLHDRVVRPSRVIVSKAAADAQADNPQSEQPSTS